MKKINNKKYSQQSVDFDKCIKNIGNKFNLVLIAAYRAREINKGHTKKTLGNYSTTITALKEIEEGHVGIDYLKKI